MAEGERCSVAFYSALLTSSNDFASKKAFFCSCALYSDSFLQTRNATKRCVNVTLLRNKITFYEADLDQLRYSTFS